ncbi:UNVERIFIED_CONTAM: hypothetical protein Scaly_2460700 [Sesamum calycinum]|uniref:Uncharacterized protein n=1 Tax=Sesamum calycinum TaxID=2727403 RepID=A0AAW2LSG0_9LAMI
MEEQILDYVLVPLGLLMMVAYHICLLRQIVRHPATTVVGLNAINRRLWVRSMMEDTSKNGVLAVQTLRNNIMASTLLASTAIMLSSVIAVLMSGANHRPIGVVYGDNSKLGSSIKFSAIMVCFLVAFLLNVQSIRYYSHASILINVPSKKKMGMNLDSYYKDCVTAEYVGKTVNRGSYFWSLGLRAFYFSFPLFLWIFGTIPMFVCSVVMVFMLYWLDFTFGSGSVFSAPQAEGICYSRDRDDIHEEEEEEEEEKSLTRRARPATAHLAKPRFLYLGPSTLGVSATAPVGGAISPAYRHGPEALDRQRLGSGLKGQMSFSRCCCSEGSRRMLGFDRMVGSNMVEKRTVTMNIEDGSMQNICISGEL